MREQQWAFPAAEYLHQGHLACPGCGERIGLRLALKTLGNQTVLVVPASCSGVCDGSFPHSASAVPLYHTAFATAAACATGVRAALDLQGKVEVTVLAWAGDGGTFDIGLQSLSGAAERNERIIYVCYDNEAYMNTGVQRSSATPRYTWTTTTPGTGGKGQPKKDLLGIMAAHAVPYAATATIGYPEDFAMKLRRAQEAGGFAIIHLLAPCPTGWRVTPDAAVQISRLAARSRVFPLYEVEHGRRYRVQETPSVPVTDYLRPQGRFAQLDEHAVAAIQSWANERWDELLKRAAQVTPLGIHRNGTVEKVSAEVELSALARALGDEPWSWGSD